MLKGKEEKAREFIQMAVEIKKEQAAGKKDEKVDTGSLSYIAGYVTGMADLARDMGIEFPYTLDKILF